MSSDKKLLESILSPASLYNLYPAPDTVNLGNIMEMSDRIKESPIIADCRALMAHGDVHVILDYETWRTSMAARISGVALTLPPNVAEHARQRIVMMAVMLQLPLSEECMAFIHRLTKRMIDSNLTATEFGAAMGAHNALMRYVAHYLPYQSAVDFIINGACTIANGTLTGTISLDSLEQQNVS